MGAAAAVVARARRNVVSHFLSCNAVSADSAVGFTPRRAIERRMLDRYVRAGVIVPVAKGGYYIDVPTYDSHNGQRRQRIGLTLAALALVGGAVVALVS
ncbi:hypothetical protein [Sphingomonas sp. 28-63-12]|uniref:hypothetical protein n=1 Tax=Sphingomonas sp. 28-63-12 TaxID=1970434 RepID=UPI000BD5DBF9|nr:MAG: hypothetical protein B7Y47_03220 [Sphingomonas sp. 28-63-12]